MNPASKSIPIKFTSIFGFYKMHFLISYPFLMEEKKEKKQTTIDEDEKQFADLLFGDLQEITPQVTNWIINHKIEYKRRETRNSTRETTSLA